jgi:DNA-binding XRE family transcriptional regulator
MLLNKRWSIIMGSNEIPNTKRSSVKLWERPEGFEEKVYSTKRRGPPPLGMRKENPPPKTPVQALRYLLQMSQHEWANLLEVNIATITHSEVGKVIPTVALAKRMQEEARQRGIAVTLDELYQHVLPWSRKVEGE